MALYTFDLRKYCCIFELCHYFTLFLSTSGVVSVKRDSNRLPVCHTLMSVTFLYSTNEFFVLVLHVFSFSFIFDHNCLFYEFNWIPCRIITLLKSPIKRRHCIKCKTYEKSVSGYFNCFF